MPKIGQASGPKYIPADVGMVNIDAEKNAKNWTSIRAEIRTSRSPNGGYQCRKKCRKKCRKLDKHRGRNTYQQMSQWWILRPKKMPKIGQASGPKYIPADVGMVDIDAEKNTKNWTSIRAEICTSRCWNG